MNYFELLNLKFQYKLNIDLLKKHYLAKQVLYHPDRAKNEQERSKNLNLSIKLNLAYKILKDDYERAKYILELVGKNFNNLSGILSQKELEEILTLNEIIDSTNKIQELKLIKQQQLQNKTKLVNNLSLLLDNNQFTKALDITVQLKYLFNSLKQLDIKIKNAINRN